MAQILVEHYGGGTSFKTGHALYDARLDDVFRPVDSFSSLEGVQISSTPCIDGAAWKVSDSRSLYAVKGWGCPYFSVDESGRLNVTPSGEKRLVSWVVRECATCKPDGWYRCFGAYARKCIALTSVNCWLCLYES